MIQLIKKRNIWFSFSGALLIAGVVFILFAGLNFGLDFTGGSLLEVKLQQTAVTRQDVELNVRQALPTSSEVKVQVAGPGQFLVRTPDLSEEAHQQVLDKLAELGSMEELRFESVGPTLGSELKSRALVAIIVASVLIVLFIAWSFRKVTASSGSNQGPSSWKYGVGAIIALAHDLVITTGLYAFLGQYLNYQIDALFVTAMLVVLGYSVNDTIVVYDRIRENVLLHHLKIKDFSILVNKAINETIARSINTSLTTVLVLVALFIFGAESIRGFILALIIGITLGTYSSIFVASPLLVVWHNATKKITT